MNPATNPAPANIPAETLAYWPHTTAASPLGEQAGIDLYDSPHNAHHVVIYVRFADGTRWPARSVDMNSSTAIETLCAWAKRGDVRDYCAVPYRKYSLY